MCFFIQYSLRITNLFRQFHRNNCNNRGNIFRDDIILSPLYNLLYYPSSRVNFTAIMAPTSIKRRSLSVDAGKCAPEIPGCAFSLSLFLCHARRKTRMNESSILTLETLKRIVRSHDATYMLIARCNMYVDRTRIESTPRADESSSNVYHTYSPSCPLTLQFLSPCFFPCDCSPHTFLRFTRFCDLYARSAHVLVTVSLVSL